MRDRYEDIEEAVDDMMRRVVESRWTAAILAAALIAGIIALLVVAA